jgi:hypothetical protein
MEIKDYLEKLESNKKEIEYLDYCNECLKRSVTCELKDRTSARWYVPQNLNVYKDVREKSKKSEYYKSVLYAVQHYVPSAKKIEDIIELCSHGFTTTYVEVTFLKKGNISWFLQIPLIDKIGVEDVFRGESVNKWAFEVSLYKTDGNISKWIAGGEEIKDVVIE